jgi:hypothetical protein
MVLHPLPEDESVGVIDLESQVVRRVGGPESDPTLHLCKELD